MKAIILIIPVDLMKDPGMVAAIAEAGVQSPISIEHSLIKCSRCNKDGWIGPNQRQAAQKGVGEVICIRCFANNDEFRGALLPVVSLNPDIDDAPRRNPPGFTAPRVPTITCPRCGQTSAHPKDIQWKYCGKCHQFHDDMASIDNS